MKRTVFVGSQQLPDASDKREAFYFFVGIILSQQISGERAWKGVASLASRMDLTPRRVAAVGVEDLAEVLSQSPAVHPFAAAMAAAIREAGQRVLVDFDGDTRNIWRHCADDKDLIRRLTGFRQVGNHKARVAHYLLAVSCVETAAAPDWRAMESLCPSLGRLLRTSTPPNPSTSS